MPRKKKQQKEKYIKIRTSPITGLTTYQVFIEPSVRSTDERYTASFAEKDYGSKDEALAAARRDRDRVLKLIDITGIITSNKKRTLTEVFDEYIEISNLASSTKKNYKNTYNLIFKSQIGGIDITKQNVMQISKCIKPLTNRGKSRIAAIENILYNAFKYARKMRYIDDNPMDYYTNVKSEKIESPKDQNIELDNYRRLITHLSTPSQDASIAYSRQLKVALLECINALGIRPSEALALNKNDFDFMRHKVVINKALDYSDSQNIKVKITKSENGVRTIPMTQGFEIFMQNWFCIQPSEIVFAKPDGKYHNPSYLSSIISTICRNLGFDFNIYKLRHKFATDLVTNQIDPRTFQELMGHSTAAMTIYYARSNDDLKREAIEKISQLN